MNQTDKIFEDSKFGDKFLTAGNEVAVFICKYTTAMPLYRAIINSSCGILDCDFTATGIALHSPGKNNIVSKI